MSKKKQRVIFDGEDLTPPDAAGRVRQPGSNRANQPWDASLQIPIRMTDEDVMRMDEDEWAIPSYNKKGQSVRVQVKIFPEMENLLRVLVERGGFPYTTMDDAIRHAIYRHVVWLNEIRRINPPTAFVAARTVQHMMQFEILRDEIEGAIDPYCKRLREHIDKGYIQAAIRLMDRVNAAVNELEKGPERDRIEKSIAINAGRITQEVENRRALFLAKTNERLANAALAGESEPVDSTHNSEDEPTVYPLNSTGEVDADGEVVETIARLVNQELDLDERICTFNGPDEDDFYQATDIMVDTETGEEL